MNIIISNDHAGTELKNVIKTFLENKGFTVINVGEDLGNSVDYPDYIHPLAKDISNKKEEKGIIICGSGNGVSMVANKYEGVRAALCWNKDIASLSRLHNNANVLTRSISIEEVSKSNPTQSKRLAIQRKVLEARIL